MVFEMTEEPLGIRIEFSSIMSNIDMVDAATREFLSRMDLGSHAFVICLVMREALTNAVRHGTDLMTASLLSIIFIWIMDPSCWI